MRSHILELCSQKQRFGQDLVALTVLLGEENISRIEQKFQLSSSELFTAILETVRYLYLTAHAPSSVFFPGTQLIDDIWHVLIVETSQYQELCNRLKNGTFIHHTGIKYLDYVDHFNSTELHAEQLSWLVSYYANFGEINESSLNALPLLKELCNRFQKNLSELNLFAFELYTAFKVNEKKAREEISFNDWLAAAIQNRDNINMDAVFLKQAFDDILYFEKRDKKANFYLQQAYSISAALGFTLHQHFAAIERLSFSSEWKSANVDFFNLIEDNLETIGLATTHLAGHNNPGIVLRKCESGFLLSGVTNWVTGFGVFNHIIIGAVDHENKEILFVVSPFISQLEGLNENEHLRVEYLPLAHLTSTNTVRVTFKDYFLPSKSLISKRSLEGKIIPRSSQYQCPEIGIAEGAIRQISHLVLGSSNPRHLYGIRLLPKLKSKLDYYLSLINDAADLNVQSIFEIHEFVRSCVRFLVLLTGGSSIFKGSDAMLFDRDLILLDIFFQKPQLIEKKLDSLI